MKLLQDIVLTDSIEIRRPLRISSGSSFRSLMMQAITPGIPKTMLRFVGSEATLAAGLCRVCRRVHPREATQVQVLHQRGRAEPED